MNKKIITAVAAFALTGCSAVQIPADRLERSEASIRSAEELDAQDVPAAKLHLQMAKDQTEAAKKMAANGDDRAVLVLARAEADAELALNMARETSTHTEAERASEDLKALKARATP